MTTRWRSLAVELLLVALATGLAFAVYQANADRAGYNVDEGQNIAASRHFNAVFLDGCLGEPIWGRNYYTLTQPALTRIMIGAWIWLAHLEAPPLDLRYREAELSPSTRARYLDPRTYRDERKLAEERRVERPSAAVLRAARAPMVLLASLGIGLLYLVGRLLAGPIAGVVAVVVALANPSLLTLLPRAHGEAPLICFTLAVGLLGILAVRAVPTRRAIWLGAATGVFAGLAAAAKLTGLLVPAALGVYAALALAVWLVTRRLDAAVAWRWSALALLISAIVFYATNPFLYPDPIGRFSEMLAFRQQELFGQRLLSENEAVANGLEHRLPLLLGRTFDDLATLRRHTTVPIEAFLAGLGLITWAARAARRGWAGVFGSEIWMLTLGGAITLGIAANLGLDWARYYVPLLTLTPLLIGQGAVTLVAGAQALARRA